jgi:hypothetical protein
MDNVFTVFISVIIFRIRIVSDMDTDRIFNGYQIWIVYRTDTYTNTDIFRILSKNIIYIIKKIIAYYILIELLIISKANNYLLLIFVSSGGGNISTSCCWEYLLIKLKVNCSSYTIYTGPERGDEIGDI